MDDCKCDKVCFKRVSKVDREKINAGFKSLRNNTERYLYLYGLICKTNEKSDHPNSRFSYNYFVKVKGYNMTVCQKAFMSIHGITQAKVRTITKKINEGVICAFDRRGEHTKRNKISDGTIKIVKKHIYSIIKNEDIENHLANGDRINVTKMWQDYQKKCKEKGSTQIFSTIENENEIPASNWNPIGYSIYNAVFNEVYPEFSTSRIK